MNVWLVGGEKVIPTSVENAIKGDGYTVKRISGEDRYETAAKVAEAGISLSGKKPSKVFVASGASFADALAVSPVAFAKGYPIILTEKDSTSDFSKKELGNIGTDAKVLVGGEAVVSKKVAADLSIKEDARVAGADRAVTANLVSDWAKKSEGFNPANAALVGGTNGNGADSLVAAATAGKSLTTLHFAGWDATYTYLKDHSAELTGKGFVFGGKAAVSGDQVTVAEKAAQTIVSNQSITVAGDGGYVQGMATPTTALTGDSTYTVSGKAGDTVVVALALNANVSNDSTGAVLFNRSSGVATLGTIPVNVTIKSINGTTVSSSAAQSVKVPASGQLTVVVHSADVTSGADQVLPVVFKDTNSNGSLNVGSETSNQGKPVEPFGVGKVTTFLPVEATPGSFASGQVTFVDKTAGFFTQAGSAKLFKFDKDDDYNFVTNPSTGTASMTDFVARISKGDLVSGTYGPLTSSTYTLNDQSPAAPGVASAVVGSGSTVRLTLTNVSGADSYNIYRHVGASTGWSATAYTKVGNVAWSSDTTVTFDDAVGLPDGSTVQYYVRSVKDGIEGAVANTSTPDAAVTLGSSYVSSAPKPLSILTEIADNGLSGNVDSGDVIRVKFDRALATPAAGATVRLQDTDTAPTVADLVNGTNATFSLNTSAVSDSTAFDGSAVGTVLTITVTGAPAAASAGTVSGVQTPATVTSSAGIKTAAGGLWDIAGSSSAVAAASEVQTITLNGSPTGGSYTIAGGAATSGPVAYNAVASAVKAAVVTATGFAPADITVTQSGAVSTITIASTHGNVPTLTTADSLTGGVTPSTSVATTTQGNTGAASGKVIG